MKEQEPKTAKEILLDDVLKVLEENNALCMDVQEERMKLAGNVTEVIWNRDKRTTPLENGDFQI